MSTRKEKAKPQLVSVQKEYINKYVHRNHPDDIATSQPQDMYPLNMSSQELRTYRLRYLNPSHLLSPDVKSFYSYMLETPLGSQTESERLNEMRKRDNLYEFRTKDDLKYNVADHWRGMGVKESEVILGLCYKQGRGKFGVKFDR
ncbi:hypothetical protein DAMA08_039120 [Martiniozyma asiatica (nom. inval.)]|nr:hypothetical protein DAMA08_039120 [Martiniozyma asiatica]